MYCSILICHAVFVAIAFPPCVLFFLRSSFWLVFYFPSLLCCICVCKGLCGALHLPLSWIHSNQCAHLWFKRSILCSMPLSAVIARLSFLTAAVVVMLRPCTLSMSFGRNQLNSVMVRLTNAFPACPPKLPLVSSSTATEEWRESHLPTLTQAATPHTLCSLCSPPSASLLSEPARSFSKEPSHPHTATWAFTLKACFESLPTWVCSSCLLVPEIGGFFL